MWPMARGLIMRMTSSPSSRLGRMCPSSDLRHESRNSGLVGNIVLVTIESRSRTRGLVSTALRPRRRLRPARTTNNHLQLPRLCMHTALPFSCTALPRRTSARAREMAGRALTSFEKLGSTATEPAEREIDRQSGISITAVGMHSGRQPAIRPSAHSCVLTCCDARDQQASRAGPDCAGSRTPIR